MTFRIAMLFVVIAACNSSARDSNVSTPGGGGPNGPDARVWQDARVWDDAPDAKEYSDAHIYQDAHVYMDAPAPASCVNKRIVPNYGTTAPDAGRPIISEGLSFNVDCGGFGTPVAQCFVVLWDDVNADHDPISKPWTITCGNQAQTFDTTSARYVHSITCTAFDITCTSSLE